MAASGVWPMKKEMITDALLREYLLGKVADEEQERIESLFLTDSHTRERVLAIEQELNDDYLENNLTEEDEEIFVSRYAQTDEQRRQLRISESIKDWAAAESKAPSVVAPTLSIWSRLRTRLRLKPLMVVPIAVTIVIAVVLAIVWLNSRREQQRHLAIEQELAQLNSPASLREVPQSMSSYQLKPNTVRSVEPQPEVKLDGQFVELHLSWVRKERYATYRAEVRSLDNDQSFKIPTVQAATDGGLLIRIRLSSQMLHRGHYQVHLSGIADDGTPGLTEEYGFVVID